VEVDNDAMRHQLVDALALLQEHLADLATVEERRAHLCASARAADGTVVVTVDSRGVISETVVDESYFDEHDIADFGKHVTAAAQAAARDVERRVGDLLAPLAQRREQFPSLSDVVPGAPDIRDLVPSLYAVDQTKQLADDGNHGGEEMRFYPTVRS
jgi:DNA-binding protein YbaB